MASGTTAVTAAAVSVTVTGSFTASYQVELSPNWVTAFSVTGKTATQFVVTFAIPAPSGGGSIDWTTFPATTGTAGNIILSIRAQIPDPVADPANDGTDFSFATIARWINDGMRVMATRAPVVQDWTALQSINAQMTYALSSNVVTVEQLWFDLWPCARSAELDDIYTSKITARSFFFGPHTVHAVPNLHIFPATNRTGQTTTISSALTATATSIAVASVTSFNVYGYFTIDSELIRYETVTSATNTFSNLLRGQGGTTAAAHASGATVTENNIFAKISRLPNALSAATDVVEIPLGLTPLLELYVLSKVRQAEQDGQGALQLSGAFDQQMERLTQAYASRGVRQGIQVRTETPGPVLYFGRVLVP